MITTIQALPAALRRSLTWDRGSEMAAHAQITLATDLDIYFCDPHSPWQRGSNENTYWCRMSGATACSASTSPKAPAWPSTPGPTSTPSPPNSNDRPRKTLGWRSPAQALTQILSQQDPVATTG